MMKVARINFFGKAEEEYRDLCRKVREDLAGVPIYRADYGFSESWGFGNYCLPGVPYDKAVELAEKYGLTIDMEKPILEQSDLEGLKVGDKVTMSKDNMFAAMFSEKATVYAIDERSVTLRKYRSRKKGWVLRVGDVGSVAVGW